MSDAKSYTIIGENIHCTRKVKVGGKRMTTLDDGREAVTFDDGQGNPRYLPLPDGYDQKEPYINGMVAHVAVAILQGMEGSSEDQQTAVNYIHWLAHRQLARGAAYLDVNVDEIDPDVGKRNAAMEWIVGVAQQATDKPLSIDSSETATLQIGLKLHDTARLGDPMLNSVALERMETVEIAAQFDCATIALASGKSGMPTNDTERIENVDRLVAALGERGIGLGSIYVDPLVFPASANPDSCGAVLNTIKAVREKYGPEIHIAGGLSNVSYGLPMRRLLNAVFTSLCMDAGGDAALVDPLTTHPDDLAKVHPGSKAYEMAKAGFMGQDFYFGDFLEAFRSGEIEDPFGN